MVLKRRTVLILFASLSLPALAQAVPAQNTPIVTGNAVLPPRTIERIIRQATAAELKGSFLGSKLQFATEAIEQEIPVANPQGDLKEIFQILGIKNSIRIALAPIDVALTLPDSGLKIDVKALPDNKFSITAKWSITDITAKCPTLRIKVPKGFFERDFEILSTPLQLGLAKKSNPVLIELSLIADLQESGTRIVLQNLKTNLMAQKSPTLFLNLGKLTVDGKALELEIKSNGKSILATEPNIRAQFQHLEPEVTKTIREKLTAVLTEKFKDVATKIAAKPPVKIELKLNEVLKKYPDDKVLQALLKDTSAEFMFSYLQYVSKLNLFSAQVASKVCFDKQCLANSGTASPISSNDFASMNNATDVGILIYESWMQNVLHSPQFQKRIHDYFLSQRKNEGTDFGKYGVRVHFSPDRNVIAVVLNLEIDIKKTASKNAKFGKKLRLWFGDQLERIFGSGKITKVPVEITAKFKDITTQMDGSYQLNLETTMPFNKDGTIINTYQYPSNVADMTKKVRALLLEEIESEVRKLIPEKIQIPLGKGIEIQDLRFLPTGIQITPNHGLLVTGEMKTETTTEIKAKIKPEKK